MPCLMGHCSPSPPCLQFLQFELCMYVLADFPCSVKARVKVAVVKEALSQ